MCYICIYIFIYIYINTIVFVFIHICFVFYIYIFTFIHSSISKFIQGSFEVKLPTIWTDGKADVGRVRGEKKRSEKIREEKK